MNIHRKNIPLKGHFFFFFGSFTVFPFLIVYGKQLGIPIDTFGLIAAIILLLNIVIKPFIALLADSFPKAKKGIFFTILFLTFGCLSSLGLVPPLYQNDAIQFNGFLKPSANDSLKYLFINNISNDVCLVDQAWDCSPIYSKEAFCDEASVASIQYNETLSKDAHEQIYNVKVSSEIFLVNYSNIFVRFFCKGAVFNKETCQSPWLSGPLWMFFLLFTIGFISFSSANSITDAICMDSVGKDGNYGTQRVWGTMSYGVMGLLAGLFVDWYSGQCSTKNYAPIFIITLLFGFIDISIAIPTLRIPKLKAEGSVVGSVIPLLKSFEFLALVFFTIFNGAFDGIIGTYLFVLQEDMAEGSPYMKHLKVLQGMSLLVASFAEIPFMWMSDWFIKKLGPNRVMCLVFFLYMVRLFGLALLGSYGPVWSIPLMELLNGPCFGLGYSSIVVQSSNLSLPGTSATVQSILNISFESIGYSISVFLGGVIYRHLGGPGIYYTFGGISFIIFILKFLSTFWFEKKSEINKSEDRNIEKESEKLEEEESNMLMQENAVKNEKSV